MPLKCIPSLKVWVRVTPTTRSIAASRPNDASSSAHPLQISHMPRYPLVFAILTHFQAPVTLYGFALPIFRYGWWSIPLGLPVTATLGNMLDSFESLDGSRLGTAFSTSTVLTIATVLDYLADWRSHGVGDGVGFCLALLLAYLFVSRVGASTPNFEFSGFCTCLGTACMLLSIVDAREGTSVAGGAWPLALSALGTFVSYVVSLPGMPMHVTDAELADAAYAPNGTGYGTAHASELDEARILRRAMGGAPAARRRR